MPNELFKMLTVTKTPDSYTTAPGSTINPPDSIDQCLEFGLTPDDADGIGTPGTVATVDVDFTGTLTVPADGTSMVIWGHTFSVDNAAGVNTANTFLFTTNNLETAENFMAMIRANIYFIQATVSYRTGNSGSWRINIDWRECREQPNFSGASMDFSEFAGTGVTGAYANGTSPVYVDGYLINVRLHKYFSYLAGFAPITDFQAIRPILSCNTASQSAIDFRRDIARTLYTPLPAMTPTAEVAFTEDNILGRYKIEHGWSFRDANCQPQSGTYALSGEILCINAAFPLQEPYGIRSYWENSPGGLPAENNGNQFFLTNQPKRMTVCQNSFLWLWLLNGDYPSTASYPKFGLRFVVNKKVGAQSTHDVLYNKCSWWQCMNFNVSVARAATLASTTADNITSYTVTVYHVDNADAFQSQFSETLTYVIEDICANCVDVYFLTPPGGYGTLVADLIEREVSQTATEICLDVPCGLSRSERAAVGGRVYGNIRAFEEMTIRARMSYSAEHVAYFAAFKASPERFIRVASGTGYIAMRFNVDTGGVRIFRDGEYIDLIAKGSLVDIPLQTAKNLS